MSQEIETINSESRDAAIQLVDADTIDLVANMKTLYDVASVLRKAWKKTRSGNLLAHLQISLKSICQRRYRASFIGWCKDQYHFHF